VDRIHFILYLNFVMSSWCLSDLPVSGQITAFAISGKMTTFLLLLSIVEFRLSYLGTNYVAAQHCGAP
jgi:hypothetical protein